MLGPELSFHNVKCKLTAGIFAHWPRSREAVATEDAGLYLVALKPPREEAAGFEARLVTV